MFSGNSTGKPLNLIKSPIFINAPCKTTCLYNAPSMHTIDQKWRFPDFPLRGSVVRVGGLQAWFRGGRFLALRARVPESLLVQGRALYGPMPVKTETFREL